MKSTIKKSQKRSKLSIKRRYKIRKTLRFVRRKKLTRLKTYLRRAAPRTRDREVLSL